MLVAHHTAKAARGEGAPVGDGAASAIRGASAIVDNARWAALLTGAPPAGPGAPEVVSFAVVKSNYGAKPVFDVVRSAEGPLRSVTKADREAIKRAEIEAAAQNGQAREARKLAEKAGASRIKGTFGGEDA